MLFRCCHLYHTETWLVDDIRHPHVIHMSCAGGYVIRTSADNVCIICICSDNMQMTSRYTNNM